MNDKVEIACTIDFEATDWDELDPYDMELIERGKKEERDRILALVDAEIKDWDEYTAPGDYRRGANKALRDLRDLITQEITNEQQNV